MTLSRLYFIFKYDKLLFCTTIMGIWHRLDVIKKITIWGLPSLVLYMNTYSCICVMESCVNYIIPLNPVSISVYDYI